MKFTRAASVWMCLTVGCLIAQNPTATIVGTVRDASGAVVVDAALEVRNTDTGDIRKALAASKGEFTIPNLAPGPYEVTISKEGFRAVHETNIVLQLDQIARLDFRLELGAVAQSVEVTATGAPLINTENGAKGEVMTSDEMVEMPLNGRNFGDLAYLVEGVTPNTTNLQGSGFAVNGARPDNTNFVIDGFGAREALFGGPLTAPNLDAIQEFKMQTNNFSAEYGRMAGGVMSMTLKSGGNQFHGSLFEFLRNDKLDARNFFDRNKSELRQNQFGGLLGGPVRIPKVYNGRDRTFFLFSWESFRQVQGSPALGIVPTPAQRAGDFSGTSPISDPLAAGSCPGSVGKGACFPGNQIPASRLSPQALAAQAFYPQPNLAGANNLTSYAVAPNNFDSLILKFDERFSSKDTLSFRYTSRWNNAYNPYVNAVAPNSNNTGLFGANANVHVALVGLTYTRLFSPTLINEFRLGYTRNNNQNAGAFAGTDYGAQFGIKLDGAPTDKALIGFPSISPSGYQQLGPANNFPIIYYTNAVPAGDTLTWVKGEHLVKAGIDILHGQTVDPFANNSRGTYAFTGFWTGQSYADFLLGWLNSDSRLLSVNVNHLLYTSYGSFVQDDWKVTNRLTLNFGLRWDINKPPIDSAGRVSNLIPGLGKIVIANTKSLNGTGIAFSNPALVASADQVGLPQSLVYTSYKAFAPRFGFAWRPFGGARMVVRGGYGIFYGGNIQNGIRTGLFDSFPFAITQTGNRSATDPTALTLANPFPTAPNLTGNLASLTLSGYELHPPSQYLQSWNFTIEKEIGFSSALKLSYVGSKGTHFGMQDNINQPYDRSATLPAGIIPYPGFGTINYFNFQSNSIYNGATVTLQRRFVHGLFYTVNYTYSKSIDDSSLFNAMSTGGITGLQNSRCVSCDRGRSDWDIGHMLTANFSWESPSRNLFLRGWQIASTDRFYTGNPFTTTVTNSNLNLGEAIRPNRIGKGTVPNPGVSQWFNVADFPLVPTGSFAFGNAGRNVLDGPGHIEVNLSLYKNFVVREQNHLQFRWEVFNVLNHANFGLPVNAVNNLNVGTLVLASPGRQMQFGLRYYF
jgi:outer membrane receptor protein involved in Fe transport